MRRMTFRCYVEKYLQDLSGQKTLSIHKLAAIANSDVRMKNVLILYCCLNNKEKVLVKYLNLSPEEKSALLSSENHIKNQFDKFEFEKIYKSYDRYSNKKEFDNEIKNTIRLNTLEVMSKKSITKYKIYKFLNLNPGNINDYLTNGNVDKVSLSTSKKIYQFCLGYNN